MIKPQWKKNDRIKVKPDFNHRLRGRLGTVLRNTKSGYVEVDMDSWYLAGIGIVTFRPENLVSTDKKPLYWKAREARRQRDPAKAHERFQTYAGRTRD